MINILFSGNSKVFDGVLTTMLSACKRTSSKEPFNVYIFTMDITRIKPDYVSITDKQVDFLQQVLQSYNQESKVTTDGYGNFKFTATINPNITNNITSSYAGNARYAATTTKISI